MKQITHLIRNRVAQLATVAALALSAAVSVYAHHSQSEFDSRMTLDIKGTISKLEWRSPHARLYVNEVTESGETVNWNFELPSPNTLMRRGWSRNSLQEGDQVNVIGYRARNFPTIGIARQVMDKQGKPMFSGVIEPEE